MNLGAWIVGSQGAVVQESSFEFLPVANREAVELVDSHATVDSIEQTGGGWGVSINFGSTGSMANSRFVGVSISGVLVEETDHARVADNEFSNTGIQVDAQYAGAITGLTVEGNSIHDNFLGIHFLGVADSSIRDDFIRNSGHCGIFLDKNMACPEDTHGPGCYYSTGNVITDDEVLASFIDLRHHEKAVGDTWERNTCQTKEGAEIPPCPRLRRRLQTASS